VLFTSRNRAAEGLRLPSIADQFVDYLSDEAAQRVMLADGVQLDQQQLQQALKFCGGLPLALTLLHGALHGAQQAGGSAESILQRLEASGSISCDKNDKLWEALRFSVECLSEELQMTWIDLVQLYARPHLSHMYGSSDPPLQILQCLFGQQHLQDLERRNLVVLKGTEYCGAQGPCVEVVVHDVLLCMANHMCTPDSEHYHHIVRESSGTQHGVMCLPTIQVRQHASHRAFYLTTFLLRLIDGGWC
jgi:hypothetical protein